MTAKTALFVDDEISILQSIKRTLWNSGFEIILCTSPIEALNILKSKSVQVIVTDYRMPEMTGAEFLNNAQMLCPGSVRMVLSAYADSRVIGELIEEGHIFKFLLKPWDNAELKAAVLDAFKHYGRLQEMINAA